MKSLSITINKKRDNNEQLVVNVEFTCVFTFYEILPKSDSLLIFLFHQAPLPIFIPFILHSIKHYVSGSGTQQFVK